MAESSPSVRQSKAERTKSDILDAAWDLIARDGVSVSMSDIANAAGMTRQLLYVHFGSRGGLLFELVKRADTRFRIWEEFEQALKTSDPRECLNDVLTAWLRFVPRIRPVATDLIRLKSQDLEAANAWNDRMSDLLAFYRRLMRRFEREGALSDDWTVERAADFVWTTSSVQYWNLLVTERGWSHRQASVVIRRTIVNTVLK